MMRIGEKMQIVDIPCRFADGRRIGKERRIFSYAEHYPERRSGQDRRCRSEQRKPRLYLVKPG